MIKGKAQIQELFRTLTEEKPPLAIHSNARNGCLPWQFLASGWG